MIGQNAGMAHAGKPGLFQHRLFLLRNPQAFHIGQEGFALLHLHAEHVQGVLAFPRENHARFKLSARHGNLVDLKHIGKPLQGGGNAQVDAGEGHPEIKVQGAAQRGQLVVQGVVVQRVRQPFGNVEDNGHGGSEFVLRPAFPALLRLLTVGLSDCASSFLESRSSGAALILSST